MVIWMGPWKGIIGIPRAALELGLWPGWWQIGAPKLHYSQNLTPKHHNRFPKFKTFMWFGSILSLASVTRSSLSFRFSLLSEAKSQATERRKRDGWADERGDSHSRSCAGLDHNRDRLQTLPWTRSPSHWPLSQSRLRPGRWPKCRHSSPSQSQLFTSSRFRS